MKTFILPGACQRYLIAVNEQKASGCFCCCKATISNQTITVLREVLKLMEKYFDKVREKWEWHPLNLIARSN